MARRGRIRVPARPTTFHVNCSQDWLNLSGRHLGSSAVCMHTNGPWLKLSPSSNLLQQGSRLRAGHRRVQNREVEYNAPAYTGGSVDVAK